MALTTYSDFRKSATPALLLSAHMLRRSQSEDEILISLAKQGVKKSDIAKLLGVPASAVSNLYSGKRKLKLDEANKLLELLPDGGSGRELPVIELSEADQWQDAVNRAEASVFVSTRETRGRFAVEIVGERKGSILPEGSVAIVDPTDTRLFNGKVYVVRKYDGETLIGRYHSDPARFDFDRVAPPPTPHPDFPDFINLDDLDFEVGSRNFFHVLGRVTSGTIYF